MRLVRVFFGLVFLAAGTYLIIAAHQKFGASSDPIQEALLRQNSALISAVDQSFFRVEQRIEEIVLRHQRSDPATATILSQGNSPRVILYGSEKIKASDFLLDAPLLRALESHRKGTEQYKAYSRNGIQFIFVKGEIQNEPYSAAFFEGALFSELGVGEAMRFWITSSSGELLFHSVKRLIGSQVANLRPVASGTEMLAKKETLNLASRYTGFEGGEALGAWSVVPKRGLVLGVEWAGDFSRDATLDLPFFAGLLMIIVGAFFLGISVRRRNRKIAEKFQFDPASLDDDVVAYLEENRRTTEEAVAYAQNRDKELQRIEERANELGAAQNEAEWRLGCYESLFEQATGKQVFRGLASLMSQRILGSPVVLYRFSQTSFSLVPEWLEGSDRLTTEAKGFLADSRIFIGNFRLIGTVDQVASFKGWNDLRAKYMSGFATPVFLPMEGKHFRGAMAVMLPAGANENGEFDDTLSFFRRLVQLSASLCEPKQQLIQSRNEYRRVGASLAGSPDRSRGPASEAPSQL